MKEREGRKMKFEYEEAEKKTNFHFHFTFYIIEGENFACESKIKDLF